MEAAFTLDDLPVWPHAAYPENYSADGIADALIDALEQNQVPGAYAFANCWALAEQPELRALVDRWLAAGHHLGNHTHGHPNLNEVSAEDYIQEIDLADQHLAPWIDALAWRDMVKFTDYEKIDNKILKSKC